MTNCLQSLHNGEQCTAPAVNGSLFCRHHDPQRPPRQARERSRDLEPLVLPPLLDKPSMLLALNEVFQALGEGRIKRSVAETLLSAIKLALRLVTEIEAAGFGAFPADEDLQPTQAGHDQFGRIMQHGSPHQLREHMPTGPARSEEPRAVTRRPSDQALARLAASGNQAAAEFLAAQSRPEQNQTSL